MRMYRRWGGTSKRKQRDRYMFSKNCEFSSAWCGSHLYFYCINQGKYEWQLTITFEKIENLKLGKKWKKNDKTLIITIEPGGDAAAWAKRITNGAVRFKWALKHEWS